MKVFLIAIGGTGMRCLEAFTHLCAMGMCAGQEIEVLSLDTDVNNGNKNQSEKVVDDYININGGVKVPAGPFSAKITLYRFTPDEHTTFKGMAKVKGGTDIENTYLANLLFDQNAQSFDLEHGYRAQTQIGSYLMYNSIIKAIRKGDDIELRAFLESLRKSIDKEHSRVFILGSIFGGTGASSIPILPQAIENALQIMSPGFSVGKDISYGCTLLTQYFTFDSPKEDEVEKEKVIAPASKFSFNTKAALRFYEQDATVQKNYKRFYLLGWPAPYINYPSKTSKTASKFSTGGDAQKNPSHLIELFAACAAFDFLFTDTPLTGPHKILYRSLEEGEDEYFKLSFKDFFDNEEDRRNFKQKLGSMYALNHLLEFHDGGKIDNLLRSLFRRKALNPEEYELENDRKETLDKYLHRFALKLSEDDSLHRGWLHELAKSNGGKLLFNDTIYSSNPKDIKKFDWAKLYQDKDHQGASQGIIFTKKTNKAYNGFVQSVKNNPPPKHLSDKPMLKVLYHLEVAMKKFYKFS